jgi:hypothetical protein
VEGLVFGLIIWGIAIAIRRARRRGNRNGWAPNPSGSQSSAATPVQPATSVPAPSTEASAAVSAAFDRLHTAAAELADEEKAIAMPESSPLAGVIALPAAERSVEEVLEWLQGTPIKRRDEDRLLALAKRPVSWWQRRSGWRLGPIDRLGHVLRLLRLAASAELEQSWRRADFFWGAVWREFAALWVVPSAWEVSAAATGRQVADLRHGVLVGLLAVAHAGFYNGWIQQAGPAGAADRRAKFHMRKLEELVRLGAIPGEMARQFQAPESEAILEREVTLRQWSLALETAGNLVAKYPEHAAYRERLFTLCMLAARDLAEQARKAPGDIFITNLNWIGDRIARGNVAGHPLGAAAAALVHRVTAILMLGSGRVGDALSAARAAETIAPDAASRALIERLAVFREELRSELARLEATTTSSILDEIQGFTTLYAQVGSHAESAPITQPVSAIHQPADTAAPPKVEVASWIPVLLTQRGRQRGAPFGYWLFTPDAASARFALGAAAVALLTTASLTAYDAWMLARRDAAYRVAITAAAHDDDLAVLAAADAFFGSRPLSQADSRVAHLNQLVAAALDAPKRRVRNGAMTRMADAAMSNDLSAAMTAAQDFVKALPTTPGIDDSRRADVAEFYAHEFTAWFTTLDDPLSPEALAAVTAHQQMIAALSGSDT